MAFSALPTPASGRSSGGAGDTERSRFELRPLVRERRNRLPFERD
ncbi:hypothetical protein [Natrinema pellirubrum]|nr:hypothetical protein [Natrinema pellirubrum]